MSVVSEYIAGFVDGDGMIRVAPPSQRYPNPSPIVCAFQSFNLQEPPELKFLKKHLGGSIYQTSPASEKIRTSWKFFVTEEGLKKALKLVSDHGIIKKPQADVALSYLEAGKPSPIIASQRISELKKQYSSVDIPSERLTDAYLAGFFAAEGTVGLHRIREGYILKSAITQTSCPRILEAMKAKLGYGSLSSRGQLIFNPAASAKFLKAIKPFVRKSQKRRQICVAMKYIKHMATRALPKGSVPSIEEKRKIEKYATKMTKLKKR